MAVCPAYHYAADLHCGLVEGHGDVHVTAASSPLEKRRRIYRWRIGRFHTVRSS